MKTLWKRHPNLSNPSRKDKVSCLWLPMFVCPQFCLRNRSPSTLIFPPIPHMSGQQNAT